MTSRANNAHPTLLFPSRSLPLCSCALFSTLVSRQRERFPLLVSIKRVNSLHLSTYHLRAPAWRADDLSVLPDTVWETVISLIRDRARAIISDMILTSWNPSTLIHESVKPVTSTPPSISLFLSQGKACSASAKSERTGILLGPTFTHTKRKIWCRSGGHAMQRSHESRQTFHISPQKEKKKSRQLSFLAP